MAALALLLPASARAYTCDTVDGAACPLPGATCFVGCDEGDLRAAVAKVNACPANTTPTDITLALGPDAATTCGSSPVPLAMAPTAPATAVGACGDDNGNRYNALCLTASGVTIDGRGAVLVYAGDHICASCDGECALCPGGTCANRQPALLVLRGDRNTVKNLELRFFPEGLHVKAGSNHTISNVTSRYACEEAMTIDSTSGTGNRIVRSTLVGNTNAASGGGTCWSRREGSSCTTDADCATFAAGTRCYCGLMSQLGSCATPPAPPLWPAATPGQCFAPSPCGIDKAIQLNGGQSTIGGTGGDGNRIDAFGQPVHVVAGTHTIASNVTCGDHANRNVCQAYDVSGGSAVFVGNRMDHCKFGIRVVGPGQADADGNVITNGSVSAFQVKGPGGGRLRGENNRMRNNGYAAQSDCQAGAIVARDDPNAAIDFGGGDFGGAPVFGGAVSTGGNVSCQAGTAQEAHVWNVTDCPCALDAGCSCMLDSPAGSSCGSPCGLVGPCCTRDADGACHGSAGGDASIGIGAAGVAANWFDPLPMVAPALHPNVIDRSPVHTRVENANAYGACNAIVVPECECFGQPDGAACNDGNGCTRTDVCQGGICVGRNPVVCVASDACHQAGSCDSATGTCSNPMAADGTPCGASHFCEGGTCTAVPAPDADGDGLPDGEDDCPNDPDPAQRDLDGDGVGDVCDPADAVVNVTKVRIRGTASGLANGMIASRGNFTTNRPGDSFDADAGIAIHVTDGNHLDHAVAWSARECTKSAAGAVVCRSGDRLAVAKFSAPRTALALRRWRLRVRHLAVTGPFAAPVTVTITHGVRVDRVGVARTCVGGTTRLRCF